MEKKNLEITEQEANALLQIINVAVKASGLENNVAENGIYFVKKLNAVFAKPKPVEKSEFKKSVENLKKGKPFKKTDMK